MFPFRKKPDQEPTCFIMVPEDPLVETSRLVRAEGRIIGDKVAYPVTSGRLKGFDCWLGLCDCRTSCVPDEGAEAPAAATVRRYGGPGPDAPPEPPSRALQM